LLRFLIAIAIVSGVSLAAAALLAPVRPSFLYPTTVLLALVTLMLYRYLQRQKEPQFFVQLYLATMAFKLLVSCGYVFTIAVLDKPGAFPNVLYFLCLYVVFTAVEVAFLYHKNSSRN
jgi:hypothetical protein